MRILPLLFAALLLPASSVLAGETPWQEVMPGVKLRLISSGALQPDGSTLFGLEIDMPENTKTYWRVPGETGLATQIDLAGSTGVGAAQIVWPHPRLDLASGYLDYVYFGHTLLPIKLAVEDEGGSAVISALLGICSDICVPAQASFTLPLLDAKADGPNGLRIRQALAAAPIPWSEGEEPLGAVAYVAEDDALAVRLNDETLDVSTLIAATETGMPLFGAPEKSRQDDLVLLPILAKTENSALEGQDVQLTFMTAMGAFELRRTIGADETSE